MSTEAHRCGRLGLHTISDVAERAAILVIESNVPMAVCLDPDGRVTVESPEHAVPDEIVGVYTRMNRVELYLLIDGDIAVAVKERRLVFGASRRSAAANARRLAA